jgi:hypothetical protein
MIQIGQDDLLRALKRCKGIAKQDLLPNNLVPQSDYRKTHAEARRETYTKLIELVEDRGIQDACVFAFSEYRNLPATTASGEVDPSTKGHSQALEMFFNVIGINAEQMQTLHEGTIDFHQLLNYTPEYPKGFNNQILAH